MAIVTQESISGFFMIIHIGQGSQKEGITLKREQKKERVYGQDMKDTVLISKEKPCAIISLFQ